MKTLIAIAVSALSASVALAGACCGAGAGGCQAPAPKKAECPSGVCSLTQAPVVSEEGFQLLTSGDMKKVVESKSAIVLDARTGKYDDGKRIPGALSLSAESSKAEVEKTIPDKKSAIVTYCSNLKCPASGKLAKHLKALGYTNIKEYPEGIQGWMAAGNPVIEKK